MNDWTGLRAALESHCLWMREVNYALTTVGKRRDELLRFSEWCGEREISDLADITLDLLERYRRHLYLRKHPLTGEDLTFSTQRNRLGDLRSFFHWCYKQRLVVTNPAADFELPRLGKQLPRNVLTIDEVEQVLSSVTLDKPTDLRDRAILETLYSTGIRRKELAGLKWVDLDVNGGAITVRQGKGQKDRVLPIGERALAWIATYKKEVRPQHVHGEDPGFVFLTREGRGLNIEVLTHMVGERVKASGIAKTGACHSFRHTMATLMLDGGADIRHVQEMLGHESLRSTQIYTRVSIHKLKEAHKATHPGASLKSSAKPKGDKPD